jgi:hypothetical protein
VSGQRTHYTRGPHIPQEDSLVVGPTDEHVAFWRELKGVDIIVVAEEGYGVRLALLVYSATVTIGAIRNRLSLPL